jgi:hypothetical protein
VRRIVSAAVVTVALAAAYGCGSSGSDTSIDAGIRRNVALQPAADDTGSSAVNANGLKTVRYQSVEFDVPADWPVHDLAAEPNTCVRFDVNAVYLGHPSEDMDCPAGLVGRADAVLVEPVDGDRHGGADDAPVGASATGLAMHVANDGPSAKQLEATVPSANVRVTLPYRDSDAAAQQILGSFREVGS